MSLVLDNSGSVARDHLASERTFLAYVRTSLALSSAGVGERLVFVAVLAHERKPSCSCLISAVLRRTSGRDRSAHR